MKFLLLCLLALPFQDLPTFGDMSEIKGKTAYYVVTEDSHVRRTIQKEIGSLLKPERDPEKAEIFVEYKIVSSEPSKTILGSLERGEMRVYYFRDKKKIVVWSESAWGSITHRKLAKKLRSALKKNS